MSHTNLRSQTNGKKFYLSMRIFINLVFLFCFFISIVVMAEDYIEPPTLPKDGYYLPLENKMDVGLWVVNKSDKTHFYRWYPATNQMIPLLSVTLCRSPDHAIETQHGIFVFCSDSFYVLNISPKNKLLATKITEERYAPKLLALTDGKLLVIGGIHNGYNSISDFHKTIDIVYPTVDGRLYIKKIADIPTDILKGYAVSLLADGRVIFVGGAITSDYGCQHCSNKTYILDTKKSTWVAGPKLSQARKHATASLLADGSLLVAGGFTATDHEIHGGSGSQSVEILPKGQSKFTESSNLLIATSRHYAIPLLFNHQNYLLIAGGLDTSGALQLYDEKNKKWFFMGILMRNCDYVTYKKESKILPFLFDVNLWLVPNDVCNKEPVKLRIPTADGQSGVHTFNKVQGIPLYYSGHLRADSKTWVVMETPFRALTTNDPEKSSSSESITITDIIWSDGRIRTLTHNEALPTEILAPDEVDLAELPPLSRARHEEGGDQNMQVKQLADGRVIVAGGTVQVDKIAVITEQSMTNDAPDTYIGIGDFLPARTYEIFDPHTKQWRTSASAKAVANLVSMFSDGRVVQEGEVLVANPMPKKDEGKEKTISILEVSNKEGTAWTRLKSPSVTDGEFLESSDSKMFVQNDELFINGVTTKPDNVHYYVLLWFNQQQNQWEELWRSLEREDAVNSGRIIVRKLANGKTMALSVQGYEK